MIKKFKDNSSFLIGILIFYLLLSLILFYNKFKVLEVLRITFGSFYFLFFPGFLILINFFKIEDIIEKIAISLSLSIILVPFFMFLLILFFEFKINFVSLIMITTILNCIIILIKFYEKKLNQKLKSLDKLFMNLIGKNKFLKKWFK